MPAAIAPQSDAPVSSHRLPTQSASVALRDLQHDDQPSLSSGIETLDQVLVTGGSFVGFERGKVSEFWGPNGSGKSVLVSQIARKALEQSLTVCWLASATPLSVSTELSLRQASRAHIGPRTDAANCFHYLSRLTLTHLLALISPTTESFPPAGTSLLVIEDLNALVDQEYPRYQGAGNPRTESHKWHASRRYAVLGSLIAGFNRLAVVHNMAIIVTTGCIARSRVESNRGVAISPGIGGVEWDTGVWNRVAVFRDFEGHYCGKQKLRGRTTRSADPTGDVGYVVKFIISSGGVAQDAPGKAHAPSIQKTLISSNTGCVSPFHLIRKRAHDEIADSDDEELDEFGWHENDEDVVLIGVLPSENRAGHTNTNRP